MQFHASTPSVPLAISRTRSVARVVGALLAIATAVTSSCAQDPEVGEQPAQAVGTVTVSFQDGVAPSTSYRGGRDTELVQSTPGTNRGTATTLRADRDAPDGTGQSIVSLLRWDLAAIPAGSTVTGATLTLGVSNMSSTGSYELYALKHDWTEGVATWSQATSARAWGAAGARGTDDRQSTSLGTLNVTATGSYTVALNAAGVAQVQTWIDNPASNFGVVVDSANNLDGLGFDSREGARAPRLTVSYAPPASATGGLRGEYFTGTALGATPALTRTDATVNFDWGTGSPASTLPVDRFSVRWSGRVVPRFSESYTFTTTSDDGVRLWINGQKLIDNWTDHAPTDNRGTIALTAGQAYELRLEFYENGGGAVAKLAWSSASQTAEIVPQSQLRLPSSTTTDAGVDAGTDAGVDAAVDARVDASLDAGPPSSDSFVLGQTRPVATNTGVPSGITLRRYDGDIVVTTPGTVLDGLDIHGFVSIRAANVTIQNCRIRGRDVGFTYYGLVDCRANAANAIIRRSTLRADYPRWWLTGINGGNFTSERNDISGVVDGHYTNVGNIQVYGNYLHDFFFSDQSQDQASSDPPYWTHNDGIQFRGTSLAGTSIVKGNNFDWYPDEHSPIDRTAALRNGAGTYYSRGVLSAYSGRLLWGAGITVSPDLGPVTHCVVTQNWFEGGTAGFQMNELDPAPNGPMDFGELSENRFGMDQFDYYHGSRYQIRYKRGAIVAGQLTNYFDNVGSVPVSLRGVRFTVGETGGIRIDP